ncbi:MAG: hypothetical protein U5O15_09725 [Candidatus Krumholzibacteriota bacterium]|nr:hypothetical protein [Candidatus Krumholzibacteriota bacterium]
MKKVFIVLAVIVIVIAAGIWFLYSNLNSLVAGMIEKYGSEATQTSVTVSEVDISISDSKGSIKGLTVANPDGFDAASAFEMDDITLDINVESLRSSPIIIEEIRVMAPVVYAEFTGSGSSNLNQLRKNVEEYTADKTGEAETEKKQKRLIIRKFIFEEGKIEMDATALGAGERTVTLPEIRMTDIGGEKGATPGEIASIILKSVAGKAASRVAGSELKSIIENKLGDEGAEKAKELIKNMID